MIYKRNIFWFLVNIVAFSLGLYFLFFSIYGNSGYNEVLKIDKLLASASLELNLIENRKKILDTELNAVYNINNDMDFLDEKLKENFSLIRKNEIIVFDTK